MFETWKSIPGYENHYAVSQYGRVKSLKRVDSLGRTVGGITLKQSLSTAGYPCVNLWKSNKMKRRKVHLLVAMAFKGHQPKDYEQIVDHIDNNKLNSKLSNLQIISQRKNVVKDLSDRKKSNLPLGVFKDKNKYRASIYFEGRLRYLGTFKDAVEASEAYQEAFSLIESGETDKLKFAKKPERKHSLPKGVFKNKKRFMARTRINGVIKYLGTFDTPEEASEVYQEAVQSR